MVSPFSGALPCENDAAAQAFVVLGGQMQSGEWIECTNSVIIWDPIHEAMEKWT